MSLGRGRSRVASLSRAAEEANRWGAMRNGTAIGLVLLLAVIIGAAVFQLFLALG